MDFAQYRMTYIAYPLVGSGTLLLNGFFDKPIETFYSRFPFLTELVFINSVEKSGLTLD